MSELDTTGTVLRHVLGLMPGMRALVSATAATLCAFGLACSPDAICVGQVIRRTEGAVVAAQCFDDGTSHCVIAPVCRLRGVLAEAISAFYKVLDNYTLADLVTNRDQLVQALFFESPASIAARKAAP